MTGNGYPRRLGFTLIELLIVVAIIGILAAIAVPNFLNAQTRANLARVAADHQALTTALEQYYLDQSSYPPNSHSDNDNRGFIRLTTPVAFLHTVLVDPFAKKYIQNRGNDFDLVYEFNTASRNGGKQFNMYVMESLGPDGHDDFNSTLYPSHSETFQFYDPSNGLKSRGDILRAGGTYLPRWYRERKGGPATRGKDWQ